MSEGAAFDDALLDAQLAGYAEADPLADISGRDSAAKIALLASLAFDARFTIDDVDIEGIEGVASQDVAVARRRGRTIKLIATAERSREGVILRVAPTELADGHRLAGVRFEHNGVVVVTELAGELTFIGPGAGGDPTASAVIGDVLSAARHVAERNRNPHLHESSVAV